MIKDVIQAGMGTTVSNVMFCQSYDFQFSYNCFHIDLIKVQILKPVTLYTRILIIFVAIAWFSELNNIEDKMKHWFGILKPYLIRK